MTHLSPKKRKLDHGGRETTPNEIFDAPKHATICPMKSSSHHLCESTSDRLCPSPVSQIDVMAKQQRCSAESWSTAHSSRVPISEIFKLRAEGMLARTHSKHEESMAAVDATLREIKEIIMAIPDHGPMTIENAKSEISRSSVIQIPFPNLAPKNETQCHVSYGRPSSIDVVGSYAQKTAIFVAGKVVIDLAITMPSKIFQPKDYLDYRYFHKRAYYLARIARALIESESFQFLVEYTYQNDNHLKPAILVESSGKTDNGKSVGYRYSILIYLSADEHLFPPAKLMPTRACVQEHANKAIPNTSQSHATPFYNSSLRSDQCSLAYLDFVSAVSLQCESFRDACILGGMWLRQRGLQGGLQSGGYGNFEWACTMALLLQAGGMHGRPVLMRNHNSFQMFKATLKYLAATDLHQSPISIQHKSLDIRKAEGPILFDGARGINILYKMTPWSYAALRHEARKTIELFSEVSTDHFGACFVLQINDPSQQFDLVISCAIDTNLMITAPSPDAHTDLLRTCMHLYKVLKKGLGDRVRLLYIQQPQTASWSLTCSNRLGLPESLSPVVLEVGLLLDPENCRRVIDKGPPAEDKLEAASFREFWGEKAELRRFKDGSILETVVWAASRSRPDILMQIIEYIILSHCGQSSDVRVSVLEASFARLLQPLLFSSGHALTLQREALSAYEGMEQQIRRLQGLPLQIRHVSGGDPQLRYASLNTSTTQQHSPININIQFESSNKWPDSLIAVQRTKIAFLTKIGDLFHRSKAGLSPRLGFDSTTSHLENSAFLDIPYSAGIIFRLRIHHEREQDLLKLCLSSPFHGDINRESTAKILSAYKRNFIQVPLHTQAIRSLCTRFSILSPSMHIMKRWCNDHLLSNHISDELIELLTVHTFVHPQPWIDPGSVLVAFLRTLSFISRWDWRTQPLIVDFAQKMMPADYEAIIVRFDAWRKIDPGMNRVAIFAATNFDPNGSTWTETGPTKAVAARMTRLARAACTAIKPGLHTQAEALFTSNLNDYDFVVHLDAKITSHFSPRSAERSCFKNLRSTAAGLAVSTPCDPGQMFLIELDRLYGNYVTFFHNRLIGNMITGVWNPQRGSTPWKIKVGSSSKPMRSYGRGLDQISVNKKEILHDIARLGGDMISKMDVN